MSKKKASKKATMSSVAKKKTEKVVKAAKPAKLAKAKPNVKATAKPVAKSVKAAKPPELAHPLKKQKTKAENSQVALQKEAKKKQDVAPKAAATTEPTEVLDPGLLTKQQVKSLEKLIQKNAEWTLISGVLEANARPYKMHDKYQEKMAIKHPVLGLGYVTLAENHKMTVLFKDGSRNLIMNYKS